MPVSSIRSCRSKLARYDFMNPVFVQQTQALSWVTIASKLAPAETFFA